MQDSTILTAELWPILSRTMASYCDYAEQFHDNCGISCSGDILATWLHRWGPWNWKCPCKIKYYYSV